MFIYILGVFTEKLYSKPLEWSVVYIPIVTSTTRRPNKLKNSMAFYNVIERRCCSASYTRLFVKMLIETYLNISNELIFPDDYRRVSYIWSLTKLS